MGDRTHKDKEQETLRARARERMEKGLLPRTRAAKTWGGRGSGLPCGLCDKPILEADPEMELEFEGAAAIKSLRLHLQCHSAWDAERHVPIRGAWTLAENALPPYEAIVEARVNMGGGRPVILSVKRVKGRGGDSTWMNVTTHSPLPKAWRPVEWREPAGEPAAPPAESSTSKRA
jgi:hypothetical protein